MSKPCQLRVLESGKYCCQVDQFEVYDNCLGQLKFANLPEVAIEYEITPDTWIPATPATISGAGCVDLLKPGTYRFDIDCEALDGTVAPEEAPMSLCYECCRIEDWGPILSAQLEALCEKLLASDDTAANVEIINELQAICDKLLDLITNIGDLSAVAESLQTLIDQLTALCDKIEEGFDNMLECLEEIKVSLGLVVDGLVAICEKLDTANTNLEAICTKLDTANTSLEALCDKLDNILAAITAAVAAIALLKECNTAENEAICAKLEALLEQGVTDADCLAQIKTLLEEAKACNTEENTAICGKLDTLLEAVCPKPPCAATGTNPVTYTNSDNETEMDVSLGGNGDIKISSGSGDGSDAEITAYITACLAAGNDVDLTVVGLDPADTVAVTLLAAAQTNPFPGFYNQAVDGTGTGAGSFKVQTMTATCLETVEEAGVALKTYDQCAVTCLEDIKDLLTKPQYQSTVVYESNCVSLTSNGVYTTAPDVATDATGVSLIGEDFAGNEIVYFQDPVGAFTWVDYCTGRLEELTANALTVPYQLSCLLADGSLTIALEVCDENLQNIGFQFAGGDATVNSGTGELVVQQTGTLVVCGDDTYLFDCFGNIVTEYEIVKPAEDNSLGQCVAQIKNTLQSVLTECEDACAQSAVIGWCGRPAQFAEYSYGDITESSLPDFNAAWEAAGGKTWIAAEDGVTGGECHWFCPAIEGATFTINGVAAGNGNVVVSPNPNAEALGCVAKPALSTVGCLDAAILAALESMATNQELATAKLCVIEENTNTAAPCAEPVPENGLDKEALTLTISGDVVANYPEGQAISLQNANAENCGSATSAGGAEFNGTSTVIPITECELDEGKTPAVIVKAQPVKTATLAAIKTIKTLTAVRTLTKATVIPVREVTLNTFQAEEGSFVAADSIKLLSAERTLLGTATIAKVSETTYAMEKNTVAEADLTKVAFAEKATLTKTAEKV